MRYALVMLNCDRAPVGSPRRIWYWPPVLRGDRWVGGGDRPVAVLDYFDTLEHAAVHWHLEHYQRRMVSLVRAPDGPGTSAPLLHISEEEYTLANKARFSRGLVCRYCERAAA